MIISFVSVFQLFTLLLTSYNFGQSAFGKKLKQAHPIRRISDSKTNNSALLLVKACVCVLSHQVVSNSATIWTVAHQAPLSMVLFRQEYCSGFLFPSPGDLPNPGIEPGSPALQTDSLPSEPPTRAYYDLGIIHMY